MKEAEDRSSYHEEAEKLFVTYMEWNEYFLDKTDPNVVFYEDNNKIEKLTTAQINRSTCCLLFYLLLGTWNHGDCGCYT